MLGERQFKRTERKRLPRLQCAARAQRSVPNSRWTARMLAVDSELADSELEFVCELRLAAVAVEVVTRGVGVAL